jgi:hypothetical protein
MAAALHPIVDEALLGLRNSIRAQRERPAEALFLLLAWAAVFGIGWFVYQRAPGEPLGAAIESAARSRWLSGAVLAALAFWLVHAPVMGLRRHLANSWWAALPIRAGRATRTLAMVGLALTALLVGGAELALRAVAALVRDPERWYGPARAMAAGGLGFGGLVGTAYALRPSIALDHAGRRWGHGVPLFRLRPLERASLPVFAQWQRIETLRRFRAGGRWWQWLLMGLAIPSGYSLPSLTGLVLMGVVLIWYGLAMTMARETIVAAARLTAATPLRFADFARATARYPLLAAVVATVWGTVALLLQAAPPLFLVGWPMIAIGWAVLELAVSWHARRTPRSAGVRLAVDAVAILGAAQALPLLAPVVWAGLVAAHVIAARRIP